jgi:hypothetical protein
MGCGGEIALLECMTNSKIETTIISELSLESEDRSRNRGRGHRLLTMIAAGFIFLAVCLMFVDFRRLDHLAPRQQIHNGHTLREARPAKMVEKREF